MVENNFSRRQFLIGLGGLAGMAIAGWYFQPNTASKQSDTIPVTPDLRPSLKPEYEVRETADGVELFENGQGKAKMVGRFNDIGGYILSEMDGVKSVEEIATGVLSKLKVSVTSIENFQGKTALFIATLAEAGFLSSAFYINVVESEVTT
ncbi:MAG: PqqD family protein [Syntrophomonas sp.]